ncbi:hypothetical protein ACLHZ5_14180 [Aeromonas media]|uniref:hypothetical protein n=1 Tax=Aeromonas TaxID=642 RepID=UPI000F78013A|nr:hypothetical protein [Aeromonas salmonicida]
MTETLGLTTAGKRLVTGTRQVIDVCMELSTRQRRPISDGHFCDPFFVTDFFDDPLTVADFFDNLIIDSEIVRAISIAINHEEFNPSLESEELNALKKINSSIESMSVAMSIGWLLRNIKNLRKIKWIIRIAEKFVKSIQANNFVFPIEVKNSKIDYLINLLYCIESISTLVRESKKDVTYDDGYFTEYCALCWRLVNKYKHLIYSISDNYSEFYCLEHHPTVNKGKHEAAKRALATAIKNSDHEMKELFVNKNNTKNKKSPNPLIFYRATATFAKKTSIATLETDAVGSFWRERVSFIVELAKRDYPHAFKLIEPISINNLSSWKEWFYAVINALDNSKKGKSTQYKSTQYKSTQYKSTQDADNWVDASNVGNSTRPSWMEMSDDAASFSYEVGADVMLNILRRFESVSVINSLPRPRGTQKGTVKKNEFLIERVTFFAKKQLIETGKVNASQVARDINNEIGKDYKRQYIHNIVKSLKDEDKL